MEKVVIGMSGGVDSSVAALVLKEKGYEVIGVTLNVWQNPGEENSATNDAKAVCDKLNIPYYIYDYTETFKEKVVKPFVDEYINGNTPNPCILCNRYIKFELLLDVARKLGAKYIATGHYAKIIKDEQSGRYFVAKSETDKKDQTYALYSLTQEQLKHTLMPLGQYTKEQVREMAQKNNLINANRKDSQEICFIPDNNYAEFIRKFSGFNSKEGEFEDTTGKIYGKHKGIIHYTVGQRRGLGLSLKQPMYVLKLDKEKNKVIIGLEKELEREFLLCHRLNFMLIEKLEQPMKVMAKIRYNATPASATIIPLEKDRVKVVFDNAVKGVAPGQAIVFYDGEKVLGGGVIM